MIFSRQDALTFALGWLAAVVLEAGILLSKMDGPEAIAWDQVGYSLLVGTIAATGRYLVTRIPEYVARLRK